MIWIESKRGNRITGVDSISILKEKGEYYSLFGSTLGSEEIILIRRYKKLESAKRCLNGFKKALKNKEGFFDIEKHDREVQRKNKYKKRCLQTLVSDTSISIQEEESTNKSETPTFQNEFNNIISLKLEINNNPKTRGSK